MCSGGGPGHPVLQSPHVVAHLRWGNSVGHTVSQPQSNRQRTSPSGLHPEEEKWGCLVIVLLPTTFPNHGHWGGTGLDAWSSLLLILANPRGLAKQVLQTQKGPLGGQDIDLRPQPRQTEQVWKLKIPAWVLPISTQPLRPSPDLDTRGPAHPPFSMNTGREIRLWDAYSPPTRLNPV